MGYDFLILDLDGTLVDSRADLVASVNLLLREHTAAQLEPSVIQAFIGRGARNLVRNSLRAAGVMTIQDAAEEDAMVAAFLRIYREHLLEATALYPGVAETLDSLAAVPMAVISNKPAALSEDVLRGLGIRGHFALVLGGDSLPEMKPSPLPLLHAIRALGWEPLRTLTVGDSTYDIDAARAAGTASCAALYGFQDRERLLALHPDYRIGAFAELLPIMRGIS